MLTTHRRFPEMICVVLFLGAVLTATSAAQEAADAQPERNLAFQLVEQSKFAEATPLLEKVVAANPSDAAAWERLGWSLLMNARTHKDSAMRKQVRERARAALLRVRDLGRNSEMTRLGLEELSQADPAAVVFSENKDADKAMHEGETAYARGDLDKAIGAYERALNLDPKLYHAALFAGDMYYKKKDWGKAGEWFTRAIAINPDVETAHRYWGDALMQGQNKKDESLDKFIEAIIAEPYNRNAQMGLRQWGQSFRVSLAHPRIQPPNSMRSEGNKVTLNIDPKTLDSGDGSNHWLMYDLTRVAWAKGDFSKNFPDEKVYRHSLREEAAALRMVADFAAKDLKSGKTKSLEPSLATLVKLNEEGLLEAYILLARADQGIARDYDAYRQANRDKLRRYLKEYVVAAKK
ncbi:MAG TPA: tetratricopeptide repeat protein [Pyrinomonadaceae bacterium]|nr:tetratricopeptide repeat protein [Pyrinomonadaceae bacterium]